MKVFVLGSNGMLGSYVSDYFLAKEYNVVNVTRVGLDASTATLLDLFSLGIDPGDVIINCVGLIVQRRDTSKLDFVRVNSAFPLLVAEACKLLEAKFIHITTDCVFSGDEGNYTEDSLHNAKDIYGLSKSLGEPEDTTTIRTSIIGEEKANYLSFIEWIKSQRGKETNGYTNHFWNGITCLQFAKICKHIIENDLFWRGVKHIISPNIKTKMELVQIVSDIYNLNIKVKPIETPNKCDRTMSSVRRDIVIEVPEIEDQIMEMKEFYDGLRKD